MATNYSGLRLSAQSNSEIIYSDCNWVADSGNQRFSKFFYANFQNTILCQDLVIDEETTWKISCSITGDVVNTSLTIISPLQAGLWNILIECRKAVDSVYVEMSSTQINVLGEYDL